MIGSRPDVLRCTEEVMSQGVIRLEYRCTQAYGFSFLKAMGSRVCVCEPLMWLRKVRVELDGSL
jgi:hypothetical protein